MSDGRLPEYRITVPSDMGSECDIVIGPWDDDPDSDTVQIKQGGSPPLLMDVVTASTLVAELSRYLHLVARGES